MDTKHDKNKYKDDIITSYFYYFCFTYRSGTGSPESQPVRIKS